MDSMRKVECLKNLYHCVTGNRITEADCDTVCEIVRKFCEWYDGNPGGSGESGKYSFDEEVVVGTYPDGRPIYRRMLESTVGEVAAAFNALGIDRLVSFYGEGLSNNGTWRQIPCFVNTDPRYSIDLTQIDEDRSFTFGFGGLYAAENAVHIVAEYVKKEATDD